MKKILVIVLLLNLIYTTGICQENLHIPPGTIYLNDSLYIDKTPVSNEMFLEYLTAKYFLRKKGFTSFSDFHKSTNEKFDKIVTLYPSFLKNLNKNKSFLTKKNYFENLQYKYSPVLRITKEQASDFCKWRTEMVEYLWSNKSEPIIQNIKYRLPQEKEIILAIKYFSKRDKYIFDDGKNPTKFKTDPKLNTFVIYNISEYTNSDKIYGNNWKNTHPAEFPNETTGFRCLCEISQ